jgi:protein-tyrosine-phosphatase
MTLNRVIVVCKYNQARSITAAAVLRRFFPDQTIITAGIQANPAHPIPSSILQILDQWGLDQYDHRSTPVVDLPDVSPADLILCADSEVRTVLIKQLAITNPTEYKIQILEEFAHSPHEIPVDPVAMGESDTKIQLARAIILAIRALRTDLQAAPPIALSSFPADKAEHLQMQKKLIYLIEDNNGAIIDSGFSIPNPLLWQANSVGLNPFNPRNLANPSNNGPTILISKFEIDHTPRIFLSAGYLSWLTEIAQERSLYLLSQPASDLPASRHHEAILGLIHS